jgi:hypothetical protein
METFREWLYGHIGKHELPSPDKILLVPGNHDVSRRTRTEQTDTERFRNFWNAFGLSFPHAHIPGLDPPYDLSGISSAVGPDGVIGGIQLGVKDGRQTLVKSYPFLFDIPRRLFIFAFNSAHASGIPLPADDAIVKPLDALWQIHKKDPEGSQLKDVIERYLDSLIIDAGLITDPQITLFAQTVSSLRTIYGSSFDDSTKIAVLHHHIGHLWKHQLELKTFETTLDAAQLKQALIETSFDIVIHGHKHTNHVGIEGGLIPISANARFNPLCVISGGTVGGYPRLNDQQTFKLLRLSGGTVRRTEMLIMEIPIRETANPRNAVKDDAIKYNEPLSQRMPNLHTLDNVKTSVDNFVVGKCAPELKTAEGILSQTTYPRPRSRWLFSSSLRYQCHGLLDSGSVKSFYEVILATKQIGFRTISRLHWLVSDVLPRANVRHKVIIIIGNLENTHYSQTVEAGEVAKSIDTLKSHFRPGIDLGVLEIRAYALTQEKLNKAVSAIKNVEGTLM